MEGEGVLQRQLHLLGAHGARGPLEHAHQEGVGFQMFHGKGGIGALDYVKGELLVEFEGRVGAL
ncbi:MAG: hypothetical protein BWY88_01292 [Synergistetes bacterium ADurb.Bin520]|nr:MAG: hypothetical protein BWY88_01292 [Synergistetes bacterium ADurb.Bin520]